jgi:hypothetical protein
MLCIPKTAGGEVEGAAAGVVEFKPKRRTGAGEAPAASVVLDTGEAE